MTTATLMLAALAIGAADDSFSWGEPSREPQVYVAKQADTLPKDYWRPEWPQPSYQPPPAAPRAAQPRVQPAPQVRQRIIVAPRKAAANC